MNKKGWVVSGALVIIGVAVAVAIYVWKPYQPVAFKKPVKGAVDRRLTSVAIPEQLPESLLTMIGTEHVAVIDQLKQFFPSGEELHAHEYYSSGMVTEERQGLSFSGRVNFEITPIKYLVGAATAVGEFLGVVSPNELAQMPQYEQRKWLEETVRGKSGRHRFFSVLKIEDEQLDWLIVQYVHDKGKLRETGATSFKDFMNQSDKVDEAVGKKVLLLLSEAAYEKVSTEITFLGSRSLVVKGMPVGIDGFLAINFDGFFYHDIPPETGFFDDTLLPNPLKYVQAGPETQQLKVSFHPHEGYMGVMKVSAPQLLGQPGVQWMFMGRHAQNTFGEKVTPDCKLSFVKSRSDDDYSWKYTYVRIAGYNVCISQKAYGIWLNSVLNGIQGVAAVNSDIESLADAFSKLISPENRTSPIRIASDRLADLKPKDIPATGSIQSTDIKVLNPSKGGTPGSLPATDTSRATGGTRPTTPTTASTTQGAATRLESDVSGDFQAAMTDVFRRWYAARLQDISASYQRCKDDITANNTTTYVSNCRAYIEAVDVIVNRRIQSSDLVMPKDMVSTESALIQYYVSEQRRVETERATLLKGIQDKNWAAP